MNVITVENLGKKYRIKHQAERQRYVALRDVLADKTKGLISKVFQLFSLSAFQRFRGGVSASQPFSISEDFWALRDVSFSVKQGEVIGIIGRNGAGKSTLLKILSRITEPTTGRVRIQGRVASLLEVGTGFHAELTGRENIFLNGAILGMTKAEIKQKFDEIVAFAEVDKFLDTPVKRYSSGMYVRLAFAVAAHLEPEILIVDEVLAVGDAQFQKKCLGKMQDVARQGGRTILFVSHSMATVSALCSKTVVLSRGVIDYQGETSAAIAHYSGQIPKTFEATFPISNGKPSISRVTLDEKALAAGKFGLDIEFVSPFPLCPPVPGVVISTASGIPVFGSNTRMHGKGLLDAKACAGCVRLTVDDLPLHSGSYKLSVWLGDWRDDYDHREDVLVFDYRVDGSSAQLPQVDRIGALDCRGHWELEEHAVQ